MLLNSDSKARVASVAILVENITVRRADNSSIAATDIEADVANGIRNIPERSHEHVR